MEAILGYSSGSDSEHEDVAAVAGPAPGAFAGPPSPLDPMEKPRDNDDYMDYMDDDNKQLINVRTQAVREDNDIPEDFSANWVHNARITNLIRNAKVNAAAMGGAVQDIILIFKDIYPPDGFEVNDLLQKLEDIAYSCGYIAGHQLQL